MKDSYSFDVDDAGLDRSYAAHRDAYIKIFDRLGLDYVIVSAMSGAMGGSKSEEFLHPTAIGEDTFVRSPGGYAANVEAVTTVVPDAIPLDGLPEAHVEDTPDTPTIETLVAVAQRAVPRRGLHRRLDAEERRRHPRAPRRRRASRWSSACPATARSTPSGWRRRSRRPRSSRSPTFDKHPALVKGYIGPQVLGSESESKIRYLVDPRVVPGTRWITGANEPGKHVFDLVAGRDFTWDGVIEAAEVRAGDPAPDGSGPLELARGVEMGHIFQLGRKYAEALDLKVLDENGKLVTVTMGSYGVGVSRAVAAIAESTHDELGPGLAARGRARPTCTSSPPARTPPIFEAAEALAGELVAAGLTVLYDDRPKVSPGREVQGRRAARDADDRDRRPRAGRGRRSSCATGRPASARRCRSPRRRPRAGRRPGLAFGPVQRLAAELARAEEDGVRFWHNGGSNTAVRGPLTVADRVHRSAPAYPHTPLRRATTQRSRSTPPTVATKIKLMRLGKMRAPYYRIVVADARTKRDGRSIETIGKYHPKEDPSFIEVDSERAQYWLGVGAQPTEAVAAIFRVTGDWQKFKGEPAPPPMRVAEPKPDKKALYEAAVRAGMDEPTTDATTAKKKAAPKKAAAEAPAAETPAAEAARRRGRSRPPRLPLRRPRLPPRRPPSKTCSKRRSSTWSRASSTTRKT